MQSEIAYKWSPQIVRQGIKHYFFRRMRSHIVRIALVLGIGISGLLFGHWDIFYWIITLLPVVVVLLWLRVFFGAVKTSTEHAVDEVTIRIHETITFQTSDHVSTMKWSLIKELWVFPEVLLIFIYNRRNYSMIPVQPLSEELKRFIADKVRENGGKVS